MKIIFIVVLALLVSACDSTEQTPSTVVNVAAESKQLKNTLHLPGGAGLQMHGDFVRDRVIDTEKGKVRQVTIIFQKYLRTEIERSMYASLAPAQYKRTVREDKIRLLRVSYRKKGAESINARFRTLEGKEGKADRVQVVISWRVI